MLRKMEENNKKKFHNPGSKMIGDIGELTVAYELFKHGWTPNANLLDGHDILIFKNHKIRKIEVKTRSLELNANKLFILSKNEMDNCDFLVCLLYPVSWFLIISVKDIPRQASGKGRISINLDDKGNISSNKYLSGLNNWELLE